MTIVLYGLMVLVAVVMIYAVMQSKAGAAWGKPAAGGSAVAGVMLALVAALYSLGGCGNGAADDAAQERAISETQAAFEGFGKVIAADFSGSKAMLVTLESTDREHLQFIRDALTTGLGSAVEIVHEWTPEPPDLTATTAGYSAEALDEAFSASGADLLICLAGLPADYPELKLLRAKPPTKIAVMTARADLKFKQLLQRGLVQLTAIPNPSYQPSATISDAGDFFAKRYHVIRPGNVNQHQAIFK